jgi:hypothetical protein
MSFEMHHLQLWQLSHQCWNVLAPVTPFTKGGHRRPSNTLQESKSAASNQAVLCVRASSKSVQQGAALRTMQLALVVLVALGKFLHQLAASLG